MLNEGKLRASLLRFFTNPAGLISIPQAEERWATAYDDYARDAEDLSGDPVLLSNRPGFRAPLRFRGIRNSVQFAQQIEAGFLAYWAGATFALGNLVPGTGTVDCPTIGPVGSNFIFASEISSLVILVAPGVMFSGILPHVSVTYRGVTAEQQSRRIAAAMHAATTSAVTVLISGIDTVIPGLGGPFPVTNTCNIF